MQPFQAKCLIWELLGLRFCIFFAYFLNVFFMLLSRRTFCSILADLSFQRGPFGSQFSQIWQILHEKKCAEIEARKLITFGGLLGGAGGSGEACLSLQILQSMVSRSSHALLPLRGCGES